MDIAIQKVLETWHGGFDERGRINCYLSMLGELGEITNLYRKWFFKPGYEGIERERLLDEWGDFWYYVRLFAHFKKLELPFPTETPLDGGFEGMVVHYLTLLSREVTQILEAELNILEGELDDEVTLQELVNKLSYFLFTLSSSFDELTELNYQKLTANQDHHGWKASESLEAVRQSLTDSEWKRLHQQEWISPEEVKSVEEIYKEYNIPPQEDWHDEMQKRIALRKQESLEKRGRWY